MTLNSMHLEESIPTITELLDIPISNYITLAANDCGYSVTAEEIIVNYFHPLFLKAKAAASLEDNPNWRQAMNGQFADEYWDAAVPSLILKFQFQTRLHPNIHRKTDHSLLGANLDCPPNLLLLLLSKTMDEHN